MTSHSISRFADRGRRSTSPGRKRWRTAGALLCLAGLAACEQDATHPNVGVPTPANPGATAGTMFSCSASVSDRAISCVELSGAGASQRALGNVIGGQDIYLRLSSSGTTYDPGTERFETDVTLQSLVQRLIGTTDGTTIEGSSVFFASEPSVTSGSGAISIANADGVGAFTGANQPFFLYPQILEPYQISMPRHWEFTVPATVTTFEFTVYVSTSVESSGGGLLDAVWGGAASSSWDDIANWQTGALPNDSSVVAIPRASLLPPGANFPSLSADDSLSALRVGEASTLSLNGHSLAVTGNVDAPGAISGGTIRLTGMDARLGGNLPAIEITGTADLQRPTIATGGVAVTGALSIQNTSLSISIP